MHLPFWYIILTRLGVIYLTMTASMNTSEMKKLFLSWIQEADFTGYVEEVTVAGLVIRGK